MKASVMSYFVNLFKQLKVDKDLEVDTESIVCHAMFTAKDEYKSQGPHTDFDYKVLVKDEKAMTSAFMHGLPSPLQGAGYIFGLEQGMGGTFSLNMVLGSCLDLMWFMLVGALR